jgi:hypothetical protein
MKNNVKSLNSHLEYNAVVSLSKNLDLILENVRQLQKVIDSMGYDFDEAVERAINLALETDKWRSEVKNADQCVDVAHELISSGCSFGDFKNVMQGFRR